MRKKWTKNIIAGAFVLCMVASCVIPVSAEEEAITNGTIKEVDGAVLVYYENAQVERTDDNKTTYQIYDSGSKTCSDASYYNAPETPANYEDYIFAGWYSKDDMEAPLKGDFTDKAAYAKFVPADLLSVDTKATEGTTFSSEKADICFITAVDTLNYAKVGFDFVVEGENRPGRQSDKVYEELDAEVNAEENEEENAEDVETQSSVFGETANYFMAYTLTDVPNTAFGHGITAIPYWVTMDGTRVNASMQQGVGQYMKTVNMEYIPNIKSISINTTPVAEEDHPKADTSIFETSNIINSQGGCTDGTYFYQAVINKNPAKKINGSQITYDENKNEVIIQKYKISDNGAWTLVGTSGKLALNHANDITYNRKLNKLVVCHANGAMQRVSLIDVSSENPAEWEITESKTVYISIQVCSINYNEERNMYVIGDGYMQFCFLDENFQEVTKDVYAPAEGTEFYTSQGASSDAGYVYFVLFCSSKTSNAGFSSHAITVYGWDGEHVTTIEIPSTELPTYVEPESISIWENKIYIGCADQAHSQTDVYEVVEFNYD